MSYDLAFRHNQALDPSALTTIGNGLHAIKAAITDCRNAGIDFETDPAVILLIRHLAALSQSQADDAALRRACIERIAELRNRPVLRTLALRDVAYDESAKRLFHSEGRRALRRLADALRLEEGAYDIRSNKGGIAVSGEVTLHGEAIWVQLSISPFGSDRAIIFRKVSGRHDHCGERNYSASVRELMEPERFAARILRDLRLPTTVPAAPRLVA